MKRVDFEWKILSYYYKRFRTVQVRTLVTAENYNVIRFMFTRGTMSSEPERNDFTVTIELLTEPR